MPFMPIMSNRIPSAFWCFRSFRALPALAVAALVLAPLAAWAGQEGVQIVHVAPGPPSVSSEVADTGNGSAENPFRTLEGARDKARELLRSGPVEVRLGAGTYCLDARPLVLSKEDSGTVENPVVWRGAGAGTVLCGGTPVLSELFQPVGDEGTLARLDAVARGKVLAIDLKEAGIAGADPVPDKTIMPLPVPELFFGGRRMGIAKWPNSGWATVKEILSTDGQVVQGKFQAEENSPGGFFEYDDPDGGNRPARWVGASAVNLHGFWCFDWFSDVVRASFIDPERHEIGLAAESKYGLRQGNPSPRRWMAVNLLEELDLPGEYCYDADGGKIYFWPPARIASEPVVIAWGNHPVIKIDGASHLRLADLAVSFSYSGGVVVKGGEDVRIDGCEIRNVRECAVTLDGGRNHRVVRTLVEETGCEGISMVGGDRTTLEPCGFAVEDCVIRNFSVHKLCYAVAVSMNGVGMAVRHCEISDAPHIAIAMNTNDSVFEYNEVHGVCLASDDCGALYKGRNPSMRGNVIRYNYWHDIGGIDGHGVAAIYFDDGDGGETVYGNVFVRCGAPGIGGFGSVFSHGGHGITAENNIFVDCRRPLGSAPWNDERWRAYCKEPLWQKRLHKEVDIEKPPYSERYPGLAGFDTLPESERRSHAFRNVFVNQTETPTGNWNIDGTNWTAPSLDACGFVNPGANDYSLAPGSPVFEHIPDFSPIPFHEIGPRK